MWNTLIIYPMTNALLYIYGLLGQNFGLAIIVFTVLVRLLTYPLTVSQMKSTKQMQEFQNSEKWKKIQKKHKGDKEKLSQEQMKMYQEMGINPFGSCLPTIIQFPIIIGLYRAVVGALATTPLQLAAFRTQIYDIFPDVSSILPLNSSFLWMDLSQPERLPFPGMENFPIFSDGLPLLALLVFVSSWLQTKLMTPTSTNPDDQSAAMGKMMGIYMPVFIAWLAYSFPSGLAVYFVASNVVGIVQYALMGRLEWSNLFGKKGAVEALPKGAKKGAAKALPKGAKKNTPAKK